MPERHVAAVGFFGPAAFLRERLRGAVDSARGISAPSGRAERWMVDPQDSVGGRALPGVGLDKLVERLEGRLAGLLVAADGDGLRVRLIFGGGRRPVTLALVRRAGAFPGRVATGAGDG